MNNKKMRQKNMKNKLVAAVAMLLVSCIMMVSSTYAWFTLSTAPEVQGITTTIGANGNLEIALSPVDGNVNSITTGVGDTNMSWLDKNLTWGNLLDLSDESYGLGEITLLPAQLNITASQDATQLNKLNTNPLKVPVYGADGRIDKLDANGVTYGAKNPDANVDGFIVNNGINDRFGIRAVGTSSTQSETALNFQNALSAISNNRGTANGQISGALATYGDTLAAIAIKYAASETTGYEIYVADIKAMLNELDGAADKIEVALYNALLAISISNINIEGNPISEIQVDGVSLYDSIKGNLENGIPLSTTWDLMDDYSSVLQAAFPALYESYTAWQNINTNVTAAQNAANGLGATVSDAQIRTVVGYLMDTGDNAVTINGMAIDAVRENAGLLFGGGQSGINLQLNAGSGIFADYGKLTGNVSGSVTLPEGTEIEGIGLGGATINIMTTTEPAAGPTLTTVRSVIALVGVTTAGSSEDASVIDVTYGYALDFIFRTNAANSNLLLQSDAAQRIYGDSQNAATMGAGSTLTFSGSVLDIQSLVDMMSGVRVVFTETGVENGDIYGIAKVAIDQLPLTFAGKTVVVGTDAEGNPTYTDGTDETVTLALTVVPTGAVNTMTWNLILGQNVIPATVETITDTINSRTYLRVAANVEGVDTYYHIYDQEVELKGELCLFDYTVNAVSGQLEFTTAKEVQSLMTLDQNVPTKITALVYLDGDYVDNSDVGNSENGISNTGKLNLQFASSANLVPMNNSTLKNGFGVTLPEVDGAAITGADMVNANTDYVFTVAPETGYEVTSVTYAVDGVNKGTLTGTGNDYKIDKANVTGNIEIFVVVAPVANP